MNINIYPIVSSLHEKNYIDKTTKAFIDELASLANLNIKIVDIDKLYDADLSLILVQSGGSEGLFLKLLPKLKEPYYLLTYGSNNSLATSLEILSYLKDKGLKGEVLHGNINYLIARLKELNKKPTLPKSRYGILGKPSDWLIASIPNYEEALNKLNAELIDIDLAELVELYHESSAIDLSFDYDKKELNKALKLYSAMLKIKDKYDLDGLTIRCFDLLSSIKTTACLALALLNKDKVVSTCEGDISSMLSMHILNHLFSQPGFQANPSKIDVDNKTILLAHCTLPLDMTTSYKLDTHYESGIGVAIRGKLKEEKVTIFKLAKDLTHYYVETGTIIKNLEEDNLCRSQILIKLDNNINYFLERPYGNHHIVIYGDHKKEIKEFFGDN